MHALISRACISFFRHIYCGFLTLPFVRSAGYCFIINAYHKQYMFQVSHKTQAIAHGGSPCAHISSQLFRLCGWFPFCHDPIGGGLPPIHLFARFVIKASATACSISPYTYAFDQFVSRISLPIQYPAFNGPLVPIIPHVYNAFRNTCYKSVWHRPANRSPDRLSAGGVTCNAVFA